IYDCIYLDKSDYDRSPARVAELILNSPNPHAPVIPPHDHPALTQQLRNYGVNVAYQPFRNPPQSDLKIKRISQDNTSVRDIETGLDEMRYLFSEGRLKVLQRCIKWFDEKQTYYYKLNKNTGKVTRTTPDHAIDASRYAILSLMCHRGINYDAASTPTDNNLDIAPALYL
ncbi:UNVERIFIED_CONTAM: hypothetical protein RF648_19675, partial [Kocuria sp. CPCC 205274]